MHTRLSWRLILALIAIHVVVAIVYVSSQLHPPAPPIVRIEPNLAMRKQASRVNAFVDQVKSYESVEECLIGLSHPLNVDFDIVFDAGAYSNDPVPQMAFARVLSDRRVAKLFESLQRMTPEAAAQTATTAFQEKLRVHARQIEIVTQKRRENEKSGKIKRVRPAVPGQAPASPQSQVSPIKPMDVPPTAYHHSHACCCTLFLCAYFCHPSVTRSHVESWISTVEPLRADRIANSRSKTVIDWDDQFSLPEPLFLLNIFSLALRQQAGLTDGEIEIAIGSKLPETATTAFCRWDAPVTAFDFVHNHMFQPLSDDDKLIDVVYFRSWGPILRHSPESQTVIVRKVSGLISSPL